ncbi:beta-lactamase family protein [Micromonospora sp. MP36]|nr:beta-lactamase family protein [Micromonospora sp. MP36]
MVSTVTGLSLTAAPGPAAAADEQLDTARIQQVVQSFAGRAGYPGIAVAIIHGDQVVHVAGYGHDSSGAAMAANTPMPVASVSKSFTALAVMQLVEAGKIALDAPAQQYLPYLQLADPRGAQITVRELLNHTSGITDRTLAEKSLPQPDSLADAVHRARSATLATDPGTKYAYTNTNYHLAGRLVEVVSGQPFAAYLHDHVFAPLGMTDSTSIDQTPRDLPSQVRAGYLYAYGATVPVTEPKRFVAGSDGVITTAQDMARWLIMQSRGGVAANGTRLVSAASAAAMHMRGSPGSTYGMGWEQDGHGRVRHNGVWFTYTASHLLLPSGWGIAVLGNSGLGLANEGTDQLADALALLVTGGQPSAPAPIRLVTDLVLAGLTLLSVALGVRRLRRTRAWAAKARRRPRWLTVLRLLPRVVPALLLVGLPDALGLWYAGGRDITFRQLCYAALPLVLWAAVAAAMNLGTLATRVMALLRLRRPADAATVATTLSTQVAAGQRR